MAPALMELFQVVHLSIPLMQFVAVQGETMIPVFIVLLSFLFSIFSFPLNIMIIHFSGINIFGASKWCIYLVHA